SLLPGFEVLGNDRKVARDGRLSNLPDRRVRDPAPRLLEVLVGVTGSVAVADERGRLTAATAAKNPRHRARRETTLQREIAVKNVSLGIFDPARCRRNPDFLGGFPPKPRSVLRNRQGIPRLSRVSSRACEGKTHAE